MGRTLSLLAGLIGGLLLAGVEVGFVVPLAPDGWRSPLFVWASSATVVALSVGAAFLVSRPRRE